MGKSLKSSFNYEPLWLARSDSYIFTYETSTEFTICLTFAGTTEKLPVSLSSGIIWEAPI